jgi:hypothetical protein
MNTKHTILLLVAIIAMVTVPVFAGTPNEDGTCITPSDAYFVKDAPWLNGQPVHEGIQNGFTFWIPLENRYTAGDYLHMEFTTRVSHNDQTKIAMGRYWYCNSLPDFPYNPVLGIHSDDIIGVSEDPKLSIYSEMHGHRFN